MHNGNSELVTKADTKAQFNPITVCQFQHVIVKLFNCYNYITYNMTDPVY